MKLAAVSAVLVGACGGHGASHVDAAARCRPFFVTAPGDASEVQPVWADDSWAIARPGTYVRIDDAGTLTNASLPGLDGTSIAYDGVELGYFVPTPVPHVALFTPGDVSTLHDSPAFGTSPAYAGTVAADPSGAPRIAAYFSFSQAGGQTWGWSDGTSQAGALDVLALVLAADGHTTASLHRCHSISCNQTPPWTVIDGPASGVIIATTDTSQPQLVASPNVAIYRNASGAWKIEATMATPIITPPLAWNGSAFVTYAHDQSLLLRYDADFQPIDMTPLVLTGTTLLGVGASPGRTLLVLASATPSSVDYVQVCL